MAPDKCVRPGWHRPAALGARLGRCRGARAHGRSRGGRGHGVRSCRRGAGRGRGRIAERDKPRRRHGAVVRPGGSRVASALRIADSATLLSAFRSQNLDVLVVGFTKTDSDALKREHPDLGIKQIRGMGPAKIARFGADLLALVQEHAP